METLNNSTRQLTLDELISLQEDSPANHTAPQENEKEKKTNATCGRRCLGLFENAPRATSWGKTFAGLLVGTGEWYSRRCALTWKLVGTPFNRLYFQLAPSTLRTEETECGLLLTQTTSEQVQDLDKFKARMEKYPNGTTMPNLATQVVGMLPTPQANCSKGMNPENVELRGNKMYNKKTGQQIQSSPEQWAKMGMLPTPTTGADHRAQYAQGGKSLRCHLGQTSQLSPLFVEEMMGFPKNWTVSPFQNGEENQSKHTETQ